MGSTFLSPPAKRPNPTLYASTTTTAATKAFMPDPTPYPSNGSSKRSKHPPPPLSVPPGHAAFRLLCHASRIGGVIGKSGHVIKTLQQSTGAKIRIEDAPNESPDRVILVIAPSATTATLFLKSTTNSTFPGEESEEEQSVEVSKAQEALVKVFERILEVAAESDGGKGGKVVEKIRKESGSKVRVLSDKLPACAQPSDEIVEVRFVYSTPFEVENLLIISFFVVQCVLGLM
jgi:predicted PilT family ATPase